MQNSYQLFPKLFKIRNYGIKLLFEKILLLVAPNLS